MDGSAVGGPPSRRSRQALVARLTAELLDGHLPPGTRLPSERRLAERFRISRPIVREVLRELRERGLVEIAPGRGTFVREVGSLDAARLGSALYRRFQATPRHLVEARAMLECRAASLAAARVNEADLAALDRALRGFDDARGLIERARADIAFHALIARASHNPVIELMFGSIANLVFELMLRSLDDPEVVRQGAPYHRLLFEALRARDPVAAEQAAREHILAVNRTYGSDLDESLERIARQKVGDLLGTGAALESVVASALEQFGGGGEQPLIGQAS